ncbi:hypothetical protein ACS0TY_006463 [Phlomoides rotata]
MPDEILASLGSLMASHSPPLDALVIRSEDYHQSECVSAMDKRHKFVSGFMSSSGLALITANKALLWTDGRYFLQAEHQLSNKWKLMRTCRATGENVVDPIDLVNDRNGMEQEGDTGEKNVPFTPEGMHDMEDNNILAMGDLGKENEKGYVSSNENKQLNDIMKGIMGLKVSNKLKLWKLFEEGKLNEYVKKSVPRPERQQGQERRNLQNDRVDPDRVEAGAEAEDEDEEEEEKGPPINQGGWINMIQAGGTSVDSSPYPLSPTESGRPS